GAGSAAGARAAAGNPLIDVAPVEIGAGANFGQDSHVTVGVGHAGARDLRRSRQGGVVVVEHRSHRTSRTQSVVREDLDQIRARVAAVGGEIADRGVGVEIRGEAHAKVRRVVILILDDGRGGWPIKSRAGNEYGWRAGPGKGGRKAKR